MLIVIVDFAVAPGNAALAQGTLDGEAPIVRALPGNLGYSAWADPDQPGAFRLMHEWTDDASFAAYRASDGFKAAGTVLLPLMTGTPTSRVFDAAPKAT
jgi:quinol monooxygenase YgiN